MTAPGPSIRERLGWRPDPETHAAIRRLWLQHSRAEDRRDIPGLLATLSPDCVYELLPTGRRWQGHAGAAAFYGELLTAFPDIRFRVSDLVIGPQGVFEAADVTATHAGPWAGLAASGRPVRFTVLILFPWDRAATRFAGEKVWFDRGLLAG